MEDIKWLEVTLDTTQDVYKRQAQKITNRTRNTAFPILIHTLLL